jgi:ABC-type uncharacterized transport system permease subunit
VNVLPSGWVNVTLTCLAGLAFSSNVKKMTIIDKKVLILMLMVPTVNKSFVYLPPELQI